VTPRTIDAPQARQDYLRDHVGELYAELTDGFRESVRVEDLVYRAAERVPGLLPARETIAEERRLRLADKRGIEIDQGLFVSHVMADRRAGRHLIHAMMRPKREAEERLEAFRATGVAWALDVPAHWNALSYSWFSIYRFCGHGVTGPLFDEM